MSETGNPRTLAQTVCVCHGTHSDGPAERLLVPFPDFPTARNKATQEEVNLAETIRLKNHVV